MTRAWAVAAGLLAMCLTACYPAPALKPIVQVPVLPTLPAIQAGELSCLSDSAWERVLMRELIHREVLEQCQEMLKELTD